MFEGDCLVAGVGDRQLIGGDVHSIQLGPSPAPQTRTVVDLPFRVDRILCSGRGSTVFRCGRQLLLCGLVPATMAAAGLVPDIAPGTRIGPVSLSLPWPVSRFFYRAELIASSETETLCTKGMLRRALPFETVEAALSVFGTVMYLRPAAGSWVMTDLATEGQPEPVPTYPAGFLPYTIAHVNN
ncbi:hypothetical protein J8273_1591 [Carpediemonas membranifera]|uniref:Uncharacterized protein n=1 Tax=Carpediemonas membranifera TaxID=201153 RepID=A0A8J6BFT7_9EUKA|nr:hypothetical protein J8273_1591 [Carpediemonas membranifera]|eukprot:KAG9396582.1 hypothetical protein J8273_1591 [Carpediemonas membranifera]